ncbi:polyhydroxyalkanoate synthesis repressor PhaR [Aestuariivirga sp.]|uniref:polyhydroxyalkanoate synthesis repressor PhaR n=1 Tax=Aestuariivirga sp. TaxID=2650926 RepID=UPI003019C21F
MSEEKAAPQSAVVIKKYANRRLYNTSTSTYVTLDDLSTMVKSGTDFLVYDAKTGEDITRSVLTQIIFEEENKGTNLLPINFLRQLIRFYGDSMQAFVPGFLEFSLENLGKEQEKLRGQMLESWGGGDAFKSMQDHAQRNMTMFSEAMKVFNPFAAALGGSIPGAPAPGRSQPQGGSGSSKDDLQALKDQLAAMQQKLDTLTNK